MLLDSGGSSLEFLKRYRRLPYQHTEPDWFITVRGVGSAVSRGARATCALSFTYPFGWLLCFTGSKRALWGPRRRCIKSQQKKQPNKNSAGRPVCVGVFGLVSYGVLSPLGVLSPKSTPVLPLEKPFQTEKKRKYPKTNTQGCPATSFFSEGFQREDKNTNKRQMATGREQTSMATSVNSISISSPSSVPHSNKPAPHSPPKSRAGTVEGTTKTPCPECGYQGRFRPAASVKRARRGRVREIPLACRWCCGFCGLALEPVGVACSLEFLKRYRRLPYQHTEPDWFITVRGVGSAVSRGAGATCALSFTYPFGWLLCFTGSKRALWGPRRRCIKSQQKKQPNKNSAGRPVCVGVFGLVSYGVLSPLGVLSPKSTPVLPLEKPFQTEKKRNYPKTNTQGCPATSFFSEGFQGEDKNTNKRQMATGREQTSMTTSVNSISISSTSSVPHSNKPAPHSPPKSRAGTVEGTTKTPCPECGYQGRFRPAASVKRARRGRVREIPLACRWCCGFCGLALEPVGVGQ